MNNDQKSYPQINPIMNPQTILRWMGIYLLITFLSLLLGIAFFLISIGLIHFVLWYGNYWEPAHKVLVKALNIPPSNQDFIKIPLTWWRFILLGLKGGFLIICFYLGCRILLTQGFLGQNIIYWVLIN